MPKGTSRGKRGSGGGITLGGISIAPSSKDGLGAFTDHQVRKGAVVGTGFTKQSDTGIPDIDYTTTHLGRYVTHSKRPNVELRKVSDEEFEFVALKHIRKGQELRADYDQIEKAVGFDGERSFREVTGHVYSPPLTLEEIRRVSGEDRLKELEKDAIHRWRAKTGVELIHKEPSKKELERIWENWNLMTKKQQRESDAKSKALFGKTNREHYEHLILIT